MVCTVDQPVVQIGGRCTGGIFQTVFDQYCKKDKKERAIDEYGDGVIMTWDWTKKKSLHLLLEGYLAGKDTPYFPSCQAA